MALVKLNLSGHKNDSLAKMGFQDHVLHVDLADPDLGVKVAEFLAPMVSSDSVVIVALPGLVQLTPLILAAIHGLTGNFPIIQRLVRESDGSFSLGPTVDLQDLRNQVARTKRAGLTVL